MINTGGGYGWVSRLVFRDDILFGCRFVRIQEIRPPACVNTARVSVAVVSIR